MNELVGLPYSPWTERARWALDHHGVPYTFTRYTILMSEPSLRMRLRKFSGKLTVPVLIRDGQPPVFDSRNIAELADRQATNAPLFLVQKRAEIDAWLERIERALEAGRNLVTEATARDAEAGAILVPKWIPAPLRAATAKSGGAIFALKYGLGERDMGADEGRLFDFVQSISATLASNKSPYLLGEFSFVDMAVASAMQMVKPVDNQFIPLHPAMRRTWTQPQIAERFADVLAWRDEIYARHRFART